MLYAFCAQALGELRLGHRPQVFATARADGNKAIFLLAITDHEEVRHLLQRVFTYFIANLLVTQIRLYAESLFYKGLRGVTHRAGLRIGDVHHDCLDRRQPGRELAGVVFDQDTDKTLHRTDYGPMQHHRMATLAVLVDVFGTEAARHHEVDLHRAELPGAADRIAQVVFDLRAVERALARQFLPFDAGRAQGRAQCVLGLVPGRIVAEARLGTQRDLELHVGKTELAVHLHRLT